MDNKRLLPYAFRLTLPVMFGYLTMGFAFGLILQQYGYNFIWSFAVSLTCYSGSMQFVLADMMHAAKTLAELAVMTVLVQIRHIFYGLSLVDRYRACGKGKRLYMIFALTDETYSLQCSLTVPEGMDEAKLRFAVSVLDHSYWIAGCTVGALAGALIPFDFTGVEYAMTALFITIFIDQWRAYRTHLPALVGAGCAAVSLVIFGADNFVFPALAAATLILLATRPYLKRFTEEGSEDA